MSKNRFSDCKLSFDEATGEIVDQHGTVIARVEMCEQIIGNNEIEKAVQEANEESAAFGRLFAAAPQLLKESVIALNSYAKQKPQYVGWGHLSRLKSILNYIFNGKKP